MSDPEIYNKLIQRLNKAWFGLPDSDHLLPAVMAFYSPEEAELLSEMPIKSTSLEALAELKGMTALPLAPKLDALAQRGALWRSQKGGETFYKINDAFFVFLRGPFWAEKPDENTKTAASPINKYFYDGFMDQFKTAHTKGLRSIPINKTVDDPRRILPYEDVARFVDTQDYWTVSNCPCRQRKSLDPDSTVCEHPMEVCLHFGKLGRYIVENGLGREITKEETKDILKQSAESGLIHAISNWQEGADTICNCCRCCCLFLEAYHFLKHNKSHDPSNYRVKINASSCKACGLCEQGCAMDAINLKNNPEATNKKGKAPSLDSERCLGCGVCVYKCPSRSLILERCETITHPPKNAYEWMDRWLEDRKAAGDA